MSIEGTMPAAATQLDFVPTASRFTPDPSPAYDGLLYTVFQQLRAASTQGIAVALTSANRGEGVTYTLHSLVDSLSRDTSTKTLRIDSRLLRGLNCPPEEVLQCCVAIDTNISELLLKTLGGNTAPPTHSWEGNWKYRRDCVERLRSAYDYILIDCPALKEGRDVFSLAPLVDGVIMVVEAGKTRIDQILHAERSIEFARGKLIGNVLNKRTFTVPNWLYKRL